MINDDADSGITEVVRGADLIEPTVRQIALYQLLGAAEPGWLHLPLALQPNGLKLSKQNHAPALSGAAVSPTLCQALTFLGQHPPPEMVGESPQVVLDWACAHWQPEKIPMQAQIQPI